MQVGGGIWIIWAEYIYLVVKILILFIMKRHSQSSGYFWQLNKENFPLIWFAQKRVFVEMMSKRQKSYLWKDAALKKLGYGHFQSVNTGWDLERSHKTTTNSHLFSNHREGRTDIGRNRINERAIFILMRCHGVTMGHVTIIVTPRNCDISLEFMPLSHGAQCAPAAGRVNVQIGIYISASSGKLGILTSWPSIGWDHPILLSDWPTLSNVSLSGSPNTAQWNLKWPGPCHTCGASRVSYQAGNITINWNDSSKLYIALHKNLLLPHFPM